MIPAVIRTSALDSEEKKELEQLLIKLQLMPKSGQIVLHVNQGKISAVEPRLVLR